MSCDKKCLCVIYHFKYLLENNILNFIVENIPHLILDVRVECSYIIGI